MTCSNELKRCNNAGTTLQPKRPGFSDNELMTYRERPMLEESTSKL
jgi:hypothetical protein